MHQYNNQYNNTAYGNDHQGLLDDLGSLVGRLLSEGQGQLDPTQHRELQNYQQELNQYRQNPQYVQSNPGLMDGMLGRIIQLAGPLIAGYATHRLLQQLQEQGQGGYNPNQSGPFGGGSSGPFTQGASGPFDRSAGGPFDRSAGGPFDQSTQGPFGQNQGYGQEQDQVTRHSTSHGQSVEEG